MEYKNGLDMLAADPKLIGKLCDFIGSMPNIDFPTMGGHFFWDTLYEVKGWKLQKNKFTDHCRVIDPENIRRAWGSESVMKKALDRLANVCLNKNNTDDESSKVYCPSCGAHVPNGRFCKDCGSKMD